MGLTSARTWVHSISERFPFQTAPGKYDQKGLEVRGAAVLCLQMAIISVRTWTACT